MSISLTTSDRVKFFREKSNAVIEVPKLGAGFEQNCRTGEFATGQACRRMRVPGDAPIVISAEGFLDLLLCVFVVYLKPVFTGV